MASKGRGDNLLHLSTHYSSQMEISETELFGVLTIHNDQISNVKHVLDPLHVFFTLFGCLEGGTWLRHNLLVQVSTLGSSRMEILETDYFDIATSQYDQMSFVKHVLAPPPPVFSTLLGHLDGRGGGVPHINEISCVKAQSTYAVFHSLLLCICSSSI